MTSASRRLWPVVLATVLVAFCCRADALQGRAVSLNMLEKVLRDGSSKQALTLCGLARVSGFITDSASRDIILVGSVDSSLPPLQVDDFLVALRAANRIYARREGNVRYYSTPGCSIDPDPAVIAQLQQVNTGRGGGVAGRAAAAREWEAIGKQPQEVRVMGVPFDTHFAKVMVDADYYMKRLTIGAVDLGIPGFAGVMTMRERDVRAALESGTELSGPQNSLNRFWFCPGAATYEESDGMVLLKECAVRLLTEEEFLTSNGQIRGLSRPSPYGKRFAEGFTTHYQAIAEARPIYRELESLFRFSAIADIMREMKAQTIPRGGLSYLLNGYTVGKATVSRKVTGQARVIELKDERETAEGTLTTWQTLMSCGGVQMDVHPRRVASSPRISRAAGKPSVRGTILAGRKSPSVLYWDFALAD